jgi:aspartyl-tRNA(Asn)/glutamyl-tRNA(Gln) amidotransferase subunit B
VLREIHDREVEIDEFWITPTALAQLIELIDNKTISGKIAKTVFADMLESKKDPGTIVKDKGLVQITDEGEIEKSVEQVIQENPNPVQEYLKGKERAIGFLVGQVMKLTQGKANPKIVNELLRKKMDNMKG